ncbi:MAG TPA: DUF5996 family protein [Rhizomicrobium sp.]|nr:DUF5996 family protein [Rhizomicrobium sp.]
MACSRKAFEYSGMNADPWPKLPFAEWRDTALALQLRLQVIGKVRLSLTPWLNHSWQVPFYVTARGLGTSLIPTSQGAIDLEFDFIAHRLAGRSSAGQAAELPLEPMSVADFYERARALLRRLGVETTIDPRPSELPEPVAFGKDRQLRPYDADAVDRYWRVLVQADRLFKLFRTGFLGKASPVHLFWGGFDLAVTRFSGRAAPLHPGGVPGLSDRVTREAYSHEVSSAGFWPGSDSFPQAAFYSYAYPQPAGFANAPVPTGAAYDQALGEFILPYDVVRAVRDPDALVMDFLQKTYAAAASLGGWDRAGLECALGVPNRPRPVRD